MRPVDPRLARHARATLTHLAVLVALGAAGAAATLTTAWLLSGAAWAAEAAGHRAAAAVKSTLRRKLLDHVAALDPHHLNQQRTGTLLTLATTGINALDGYFARYLPQLVLAVLVPAAVLAVIAPADPLSAVTIAATLPLIPVFMVLIGLATRTATRRRWQALTRLSHHFLDVVTGLTTLKVFGRTRHHQTTIAQVTDTYRRTTLATLRIAFLSALVLELLATLSVALVAVGVGLRLVTGHLDLRTALLVLVLAPEAYLPLRAVGTHYHASADGLAVAEEVVTVLDTPRPAAATAPPPDPITGIDLHAVSVTHPDRPEPAPRHATLHLRPGHLTALTGPSGSGKTTLLAVLLALTPPTAGRVLVNGHDLADLDPDAWRARIGWVAQHPYLFAGTVADNIRMGKPAAPAAFVAAAAADAALTVPLDRHIGEAGAGLSAGQARRVALARAFLRDTPVLLLDEPTAGLDATTEAHILDRLRALAAAGRIVLAVTHRPAALSAADHTVTLTAEPVPA